MNATIMGIILVLITIEMVCDLIVDFNNNFMNLVRIMATAYAANVLLDGKHVYIFG